MAEFQPTGKIVPASLNALQVQALRNELFGHPGTQDQYTLSLKAPRNGTILQFRARPSGSE